MPARRPAAPLRTRATLVAVLAAAPLLAHGQQPARPAVPADGAAREREHADLHARYAEARVRLAEADLRKARDLNERFPNAVPASELSALEDRIGLLRALATQAREKPHGNGLEIQRTSARAAAARAAAAVESARRTRREQKADAVTEIDLERLELKAEVARLRAELWDDPVLVPSLIDELQVQIEQLQEQVQELSAELEIIRSRGIIKP